VLKSSDAKGYLSQSEAENLLFITLRMKLLHDYELSRDINSIFDLKKDFLIYSTQNNISEVIKPISGMIFKPRQKEVWQDPFPSN
jgi:hypothetical protein